MKRTAILIVAAAGVLTLSACTPPVPVVSPAPSPSEAAAVVESQAERIIPETFTELAAADEAQDSSLLTNRIGGDAKTVRAAQYKQAKADKKLTPDVLPDDMQAVYVSGADTWPRVLVGVTEQPAEDITPVVMLWVQDSVDTDYQLRSWAHMIPGATLPAMASPATGAAQLALNDPDMDPTPGTVLENYVKLLTEGKSSELNDDFAPDTYREQLFTARKVLTAAAKKAKGSYKDTVAYDEESAYVLQTADGGALIFAPVTIKSTFKVKGAKVSVPAADKALLSGGKLTTQVVHTYRDQLVLYIPGPATDSNPGVVAADHNLVKVSPK
ncbi:hypothetical protein [Demequina sp.]|uniref:hypothetical protein n=1 Tax=Demequina sp. TaxID=2050685 RepID=UPI003D0FA8DB